ncbi:DUF4917 family protein [Acinetobacter sp. NIPH 298]|uniref:DUF4917 family protein n=1 Tax=Acinetobacter sp. NIPH 298 TaxID=1217692 RepID=UPI0002CFB341|nr:DUF4917 family protein [Acinetobacter sp. NIPH 298]ENW97792.1 hypothetical protein F903_00315 [Acinetobacter sp. NIPH 298]
MILSWQEILSKEYVWDNLLLGNGFSCNIWGSYSYTSLLSFSKEYGVEPILKKAVVKIFDDLKTTNFEEVLKALLTTAIVKDSLGEDITEILDLYDNLRKNLFNTVHATHIPFSNLNIEFIGKELINFRKVFTTCYDLIPYWSVYNTISLNKQVDFFWNKNTFNSRDVGIYYPARVTAFYYLHGALHLQTNLTLEVNKILGASSGLPEIDSYKFSELSTLLPLFITEGTSEYKLRKIESNSYLNFCYKELSKVKDGLVVIGQGLDPIYDQHLVDAILQNENLKYVAISIYSGLSLYEKEKAVKFFEARLFRKTGGLELFFFDSETHPLCSREIRSK